MILIFAGIILGGLLGAASGEPYGDPAAEGVVGAFMGILVALVLNVLVSTAWGGVDAHYADITSKVEQKVVNNEAVFTFKTGKQEWSLPAKTTQINVGEKAQLITYTGTDAPFWWTVFPNVDPERSPELVIPAS